jgi:hypothetical protein
MKIKIEYFSALQRRWVLACITSNYTSPEAAMERYYTDTGLDPVRVRASVVERE